MIKKYAGSFSALTIGSAIVFGASLIAIAIITILGEKGW